MHYVLVRPVVGDAVGIFLRGRINGILWTIGPEADCGDEGSHQIVRSIETSLGRVRKTIDVFDCLVDLELDHDAVVGDFGDALCKICIELAGIEVLTRNEADLCKLLLEISLLDSAYQRSTTSRDDVLMDAAKRYRIDTEKLQKAVAEELVAKRDKKTKAKAEPKNGKTSA